MKSLEKQELELLAQQNEIRKKLSELKNSNPSLKTGYRLVAGSILNAYRECDLTFTEAVSEIEKLIKEK